MYEKGYLPRWLFIMFSGSAQVFTMKKNYAMNPYLLWLQWWFILSLVLYGLFKSQSPPQLFFPWEDKIQHLLAFAGLMFSSLLLKRGKLLSVMLLGLTLAVAAEPLQWVISPLRYCSINDGVANSVGVLLGGCLFLVWQRICKK